jgi:transporter family protein
MFHDWLIYSLLSAILAAFVAVFGKIGLKDVDPTLATTVRAGIMFSSLLLITLYLGKFNNFSQLNNKAIVFIFISGLAGALSWLFYFFALKNGQASKVAAIDRLSLVFVFLFSLAVLGEKLEIKTILGIILMVVGAIIISL